MRGLKIVVEKPPIPVAYGPAFEGERIRKEDMFVEFGGQRTAAFELVRMREIEEVEDQDPLPLVAVVLLVGVDHHEVGQQTVSLVC